MKEHLLRALFSASGKSNILPNSLVVTDIFGTAQPSLTSLASQDKQIKIKLGPITLQAMATFLPAPCIGRPILSLEQGATSSNTGEWPSDVVLADFNQNAYADLGVVNASENTLSLFLGGPTAPLRLR